MHFISIQSLSLLCTMLDPLVEAHPCLVWLGNTSA